MAIALAAPRPPDDHRHGHRILVCVDGSAFAEVCIPAAVALANTFGSTITLVRVLHLQRERGSRTNDALGWELVRQEADAYLDRLQRRITQTSGVRVESRLEQGPPADRIVDLGGELAVDLTIIGSRGCGDAPTRTLGNTVQKVLATARGSVLVARSAVTNAASASPTRILVPLDGSVRTESVLPTVARIARSNAASIVLAHVVREPLPTALLCAPEDMALARQLAARLASRAGGYLAHLQLQLQRVLGDAAVSTVVARHANECQSLLEISQAERSDLVVLSAHGAACDSAQSFGGVTAFLLAHSLVPVLLLQDLPEHDLRRARELQREMAPPMLRTSYAAESR
jgi:nucleotide-binding universal stress UspA family protein